MEVAKTLIRSVARALYGVRHVLVIDAVLIHSALPYEDLSFLLGMQTKDLRPICGELKTGRLLSTQTRPEAREGMNRPVHKEYIFVDYHATIDAIKYKIFKLTNQVKELYKPVQEKKDYYCPRCCAQWTQMEVLDKWGPMGFECHRCGGLLEREEMTEGDVTGHEKQTRLMAQLDGFIKMLQKIDAQDIPKNDFETAMTLRLIVERDRGSNTTKPVLELGRKKGPYLATGSAQAASLDVSVISSTETTAADQAEEAKRKANMAAQNVLPVWHTTSTVTGERTTTSRENGDLQAKGSSSVKEEEEDKQKDDILLDDELTAYYAQLAKEKEKEAKQDREEDEMSEEDVFEDALGNDRPQSSIPVNGFNQPEDGSDGPAAKRVKFEDPNSGVAKGVSGGDGMDKISDVDDEDDVEFEDV